MRTGIAAITAAGLLHGVHSAAPEGRRDRREADRADGLLLALEANFWRTQISELSECL